MNNLQKYVLRLFQPKISKKIEGVLTDKVLYYNILKKGISLIVKQSELRNISVELGKMGITVDGLDDKLAVYIINVMRKGNVFNELSEFVIKELDNKLNKRG